MSISTLTTAAQHTLANTTTYLAADISATSGDKIKAVILGLCGTALIIIMAVRALGYFANEKYGKLAGMVVAAVVVGIFVYAPDTGISIIKSIGTTFTGA